ncbi:MAG: hypothetical protein EAZ32_06265 [Cytophagia bacterium]|nr:MAG: hypothetical protein EAZ32_06265 [Cytophagia bacterium]
MKTVLGLLCLVLLLSCKKPVDEPVTPVVVPVVVPDIRIDLDKRPIDKSDALHSILGGYYEYNVNALDYFSKRVPCTSVISGLSKAWVSRKDVNTLQVQVAYLGYCTGPLKGNDFEFVATFTAVAPTVLGATNRVELTGTCTRLKPVDAQLLNKAVVGYAVLSPKLGEFYINLPDYAGKSQQIVAKMDIREQL